MKTAINMPINVKYFNDLQALMRQYDQMSCHIDRSSFYLSLSQLTRAKQLN